MTDARTAYSVAFWNCGLAPPRQSTASADAAACEAAAHIIQGLVRDGTSMLGLCEVDEACITLLRPHLPATFGLRCHVTKQERLRWDLALAYDRGVWAPRGPDTLITASYQNRTYKAGFRTRFRHMPTNTDVAVYVAHWRSRLHDGQLARERSGEQLRQRISKEKVHVLVMGDFNDEPFDKAMELLNATRDVTIARERSNMLFNPFWRHLGHEDRNDTVCGTCFHRNGDTTRWRTFDQILLSGGFLGEYGLIYERTRILRDMREMKGLRPLDGNGSDHLPVVLDLVAKQ